MSTATKSMQKTPPKTNGFWISFCVQELHPNSRRNRELTYFYSRCRCIGWLKGIAVLPWQSVLPSDRRNISFTRAGAAAGLLLSQFPLRPITRKALEGKGSFETIGFKRLFCLLFQLLGKVGRRRHKKKKLLAKSMPLEAKKTAPAEGKACLSEVRPIKKDGGRWPPSFFISLFLLQSRDSNMQLIQLLLSVPAK